ncbi:MAG: DUF6629 family protein [Gallionella sp.]
MCFSATVSYSAAVVLVTTGLYAVQQARRLQPSYLLWALIPVFFGIQQGFEGLVWQELDAGNASSAVPYALGFHFFSHFLWLWWFPLCSYLVEHGKIRRRITGGCAMLGAFAGALVFFTMLLHPEWMTVAVRQDSILYTFSAPYRSSIHIPATPAAIYALIILVPLLFSSHFQIRIFGALVALSMVLASEAYGYAYISVWCLFAAVLSLYLVYMIRRLAAESGRVEDTAAPSPSGGRLG